MVSQVCECNLERKRMALPSFSLDFERFHRLPARCSKLGRYYLFACARSLAVDGYEIERKAVTGAQIELLREREREGS